MIFSNKVIAKEASGGYTLYPSISAEEEKAITAGWARLYLLHLFLWSGLSEAHFMNIEFGNDLRRAESLHIVYRFIGR